MPINPTVNDQGPNTMNSARYNFETGGNNDTQILPHHLTDRHNPQRLSLITEQNDHYLNDPLNERIHFNTHIGGLATEREQNELMNSGYMNSSMGNLLINSLEKKPMQTRFDVLREKQYVLNILRIIEDLREK